METYITYQSHKPLSDKKEWICFGTNKEEVLTLARKTCTNWESVYILEEKDCCMSQKIEIICECGAGFIPSNDQYEQFRQFMISQFFSHIIEDMDLITINNKLSKVIAIMTSKEN